MESRGRAMTKWTLTVLLALTATAAQAQPAPNQPQLDRGRYLATVMTCGSCHTPPGPNGPDLSKLFSGGLTFDEPGFKATASNITPDKDTGIGNWSAAELKKLLVTGVRPNGVPVAAIMPTAFYTRMTSGDLDALVAYLQSVPAMKNQVPAPDYKTAMPHQAAPYAGTPMVQADLNDKLKRGEYYVAAAHCLECHSPATPSGARDFSQAGKGGQEFRGPWGVSVSPNITPTALKDWSDAEIKRAITQGVSRDGRQMKPPMGFGAYARYMPDDLDAVVAFVRTLPAK